MVVKTNNQLQRRKSSNVIGVLRGEVEPDRSGTGLPDFSWHMIPKPEKYVPNEHKM
jgi:hypothetical protein